MSIIFTIIDVAPSSIKKLTTKKSFNQFQSAAKKKKNAFSSIIIRFGQNVTTECFKQVRVANFTSKSLILKA